MIQRRALHTHPQLRQRDATSRCILVSFARPVVYLAESRIYPRDFANVIEILLKIIDPTLQYLLFRSRESRLRAKINHRTE